MMYDEVSRGWIILSADEHQTGAAFIVPRFSTLRLVWLSEQVDALLSRHSRSLQSKKKHSDRSILAAMVPFKHSNTRHLIPYTDVFAD